MSSHHATITQWPPDLRERHADNEVTLQWLTSAGRLVLADRGYAGVGSGISTPIMATGRDRATGAFTRASCP